MICKNCIHQDVCYDNDNETQRAYCPWYEKARPHGKWIEDVCSCCGMETEYNTLYCGGCGAYMENGFPSCGYGEAGKPYKTIDDIKEEFFESLKMISTSSVKQLGGDE